MRFYNPYASTNTKKYQKTLDVRVMIFGEGRLCGVAVENIENYVFIILANNQHFVLLCIRIINSYTRCTPCQQDVSKTIVEAFRLLCP